MELDTAAAEHVRHELLQREIERERRDREFWRVMFGGKADAESFEQDGPSNGSSTVLPKTDDELIARSMLGKR